jgi:mannose-6-phosphate isomerase-like protein (cupin superfamily)
MIRAGFTIDSPLTKSHLIVIESDVETKGMGWLLEIHCVPNALSDVPEHLHLAWTETFEIISGSAHYSLDGIQKTIKAGEKFVVLPGHRHIHPWNAGNTEMVYRQRDNFEQSSSGAVQDVLGVFATRADLAREGKVDSQGRPKNPLQLAVTMRTLNKYGGYDAHVPIFMQDIIGGSLGRFAELLGYKAVDSKYR